MAQKQTITPYPYNTRQVKWLIAVKGTTTLKVVATSQKGGIDLKEINIR
ncbi:hypothetical protein ACFL6I_13720 [candidate division KSB1 bacterium]